MEMFFFKKKVSKLSATFRLDKVIINLRCGRRKLPLYDREQEAKNLFRLLAMFPLLLPEYLELDLHLNPRQLNILLPYKRCLHFTYVTCKYVYFIIFSIYVIVSDFEIFCDR